MEAALSATTTDCAGTVKVEQSLAETLTVVTVRVLELVCWNLTMNYLHIMHIMMAYDHTLDSTDTSIVIRHLIQVCLCGGFI